VPREFLVEANKVDEAVDGIDTFEHALNEVLIRDYLSGTPATSYTDDINDAEVDGAKAAIIHDAQDHYFAFIKYIKPMLQPLHAPPPRKNTIPRDVLWEIAHELERKCLEEKIGVAYWYAYLRSQYRRGM